MKKGIIYIAICKCENKCYIGQTTKSLEKREKEHLYHASRKSNTYFHRALMKHHFDFTILEEIQSDDLFNILNEREEYWIDIYKSNDTDKGYNIQKGGRRSFISTKKNTSHSEETKDKIRNSLKGENNPMYGKSYYDKWVEKYGVEIADILMSDYKERHKEAQKGEKNGMFGKKQKQKSKELISQKAKERVGNKASRYIKVDLQILKELIDKKIKKKEIAKIMNVSYFVIQQRVKELSEEIN